MKVSVTDADGATVEINIGITLMVAASEKLASLKRSAFEYIISEVGKNTHPDVAQPTILNAMKQFLSEQIRPDTEVAFWLRTWEGRVFTVEHGTKRTARLDTEAAKDLLDSIKVSEYAEIIHAVNCIIDGDEKAADQKEIAATEMSISKIVLQQAKIAEQIEIAKRDSLSKRLEKLTSES